MRTVLLTPGDKLFPGYTQVTRSGAGTESLYANRVKAPKYYRVKIADLSDPAILQVFVELCEIVGWNFDEHSNHSCFTFLSLYFRETLAGKITLSHVIPSALLHQKVGNLSSELQEFCREVASENKRLFEGDENKKLLPFFQQIFGKGAKKGFLRNR